jgi:hypothetical protein
MMIRLVVYRIRCAERRERGERGERRERGERGERRERGERGERRERGEREEAGLRSDAFIILFSIHHLI